jgi:hypothetical protein
VGDQSHEAFKFVGFRIGKISQIIKYCDFGFNTLEAFEVATVEIT